MTDRRNPAWALAFAWSVVAVLAAFGVGSAPGAVRIASVAAGAVVTTGYAWGHHQVVKREVEAATSVRLAADQRQAEATAGGQLEALQTMMAGLGGLLGDAGPGIYPAASNGTGGPGGGIPAGWDGAPETVS